MTHQHTGSSHMSSLSLGIAIPVTGCASQPHSETIMHWCLVTEHSHLLMLWLGLSTVSLMSLRRIHFPKAFSYNFYPSAKDWSWVEHSQGSLRKYCSLFRTPGVAEMYSCSWTHPSSLCPPTTVDIGFTHMIKYPRPTPAVLQVIKNWGSTSFLSRFCPHTLVICKRLWVPSCNIAICNLFWLL